MRSQPRIAIALDLSGEIAVKAAALVAEAQRNLIRLRRARKEVQDPSVANHRPVTEGVLPVGIELRLAVGVLLGHQVEPLAEPILGRTFAEMVDRRTEAIGGAQQGRARLGGLILQSHFQQVNGQAGQRPAQVRSQGCHCVSHPMSAEIILDNGEPTAVQRFDPRVDRFRRVACEKHQFAETGVEVSFRRDLCRHGSVKRADHVGGMPEIGEWLVGLVDRRIEHPTENRNLCPRIVGARPQAQQHDRKNKAFPRESLCAHDAPKKWRVSTGISWTAWPIVVSWLGDRELEAGRGAPR